MLNILHIFWINLHFKRFRNMPFAGIEQKHGDAGEIARSRENASPVRYLPKSAPKGNTVIRRRLCPRAPSLPDAARGRLSEAGSDARSGLAAAACNKHPAGSSTFFDRLRGPLISSFQKGRAVRRVQRDNFCLCRVGGWLWYFRRPFSGSGRKVTSSHPRPMPAEAFPVSAGFVQRGAMG